MSSEPIPDKTLRVAKINEVFVGFQNDHSQIEEVELDNNTDSPLQDLFAVQTILIIQDIVSKHEEYVQGDGRRFSVESNNTSHHSNHQIKLPIMTQINYLNYIVII